MKRLVGLGILILVLGSVGVGCGGSGSDDTTAHPATDAEAAGPTSSKPAAPDKTVGEERDQAKKPKREKAQPENAPKATCTLKGKGKADVALEYTDDGFDLTFSGQPVPPTGTALYSATVFDKTGEYGAQLGMKFLDGEQIAYFVFDFTTVEQANLDGDVIVNGDVVSGSFPADRLGQLADAGPASWSAAFNVEGNDIGECPGGFKSSPFPG